MSIKLMTLVWDVPFPTSTQMLLALKLADHAEDDGSSVYPGKASLAERARCSISTVKNMLRLMRECGILIVVREGGTRGPHDTTEYKMNVGLIRAIADGRVTMTGTSDSIELTWSEGTEKRGSKIDPVEFYPGSGQTVPGQPADATRSAHSPQPIIKHHYPSARAGAGEPKSSPATLAVPSKPPRLLLREDGVVFTRKLDLARKTMPDGFAKGIDADGALVINSDGSMSRRPPLGSAAYDDLVKARDASLTERSKAMMGDVA
jgi:hypothetical protein